MSFNIEKEIDYLINTFNGLKYDNECEEILIPNPSIFDNFDEIKLEMVKRIGIDRCSIFDEGNLYIIYEIDGYNNDKEYIEIKMDGINPIIKYYSSQNLIS